MNRSDLNSSFFLKLGLLSMTVLCLLGGCIKDEFPENQLENKQYVCIQAVLNNVQAGSDGSNVAPKMRVDGPVTDDSQDPVKSEAGIEPNENKINTLRVIAFAQGSVAFNKKFTEGVTLGDFFTVSSDKKITVAFEIPAGIYQFVLVANEPTDLGSLTSRHDLDVVVATNTLTMEGNVGATSGGYIPMIASQFLDIKPQSVRPLNPTLYQPEFELERTLAKVRLLMTNVDPTTNGVYTNASAVKVTKLELVRANTAYNLMPNNANPLTEVMENPAYVAGFNTTTEGELIKGSAPQAPEVNPYKMVFRRYMAERKNVASVDDATVLRITTTNSGVETTYIIPLFQMKNGNKVFDLKRNTIYEVKARLIGGRLMFDTDLLVKPWVPKSKSDTVTVNDLEW